MGKYLLTFFLGAAALTASAAPRQLLSVTEEAWGEKSVTTYEYDAEGRLAKVVDGESVYTFDYSQLASKKVIMTRVDTYEWSSEQEVTVTEMDLNDDNLVIKAIEIQNGEADEDYYVFEYTDGYLTSYKYIMTDEVEETRITYTDGKITLVEEIDESESECETTTYEYAGIMNPGELAMFDNVFNIDLDDIEYVAMNGMLGKIYTELPVKSVSKDEYGSSEATFKWSVDEEGYAIKLESSSEWDNYTYSFEWSDNSSVNTINADNAGSSQFFSIDGKSVAADARGIVIERRADGSAVKHYNR